MLQREREVGNVFRLFRNPDEQYDNYAAPTAIKVIDHDKQRWAMLTLGDVLARTGVWNPDVTIRVDEPKNMEAGARFAYLRSQTAHLRLTRGNPLTGCRIIGDLTTDQLTLQTIRQAVRSLEKLMQGFLPKKGVNDDEFNGEVQKALRDICSNNVWYNDNFGAISDEVYGDYEDSTQTRIGASAATATVEELGSALQNAILETVLADDPTPEITAKMNSETIKAAVNDVVSITNDMSDAQRASIASALVGAAPGFKASKSALRKVIRNKDNGKQGDLDKSFGDALKKDMGSNWKDINNNAKKIAASIGPDADGDRDIGDQMRGDGRMTKHIMAIESAGFSIMQRRLARWYLGCSIDLPTIVSLDQQGVVTPFGAYVSCFYFAI